MRAARHMNDEVPTRTFNSRSDSTYTTSMPNLTYERVQPVLITVPDRGSHNFTFASAGLAENSHHELRRTFL